MSSFLNSLVRSSSVRRLLSVTTAFSIAFAGLLLPVAATADNIADTHLDENFDGNGFAVFPTSSDAVRVVGTLDVIAGDSKTQERRFTVSIEDGKAVLRAFKAANHIVAITNAVGDGTRVTYTTGNNHRLVPGNLVFISGMSPSSYDANFSTVRTTPTPTTFTLNSSNTAAFVSGGEVWIGYNSWNGGNQTAPNLDFVPDTTFGSNGKLELGNGGTAFTNVSQVLMPRSQYLDTDTTAAVKPWMVVVSGTNSYIVRLDGTRSASGGLLVCTTSCTQTAVEITTAIQSASVGDAGAVPTGMAVTSSNHIVVTGLNTVTAGKFFLTELDGSSGAIRSLNASFLASAFATGDYSGYSTLTPFTNNLDSWNNEFLIAGNFSNGSKTVGLIIRRTSAGAAATTPATYVDVGTDSTELTYMNSSNAYGGSYKDTGVSKKPLMVASSNNAATISTYKLEVSASSDEKLLALQYIRSNAPTSSSGVMAIASDGNSLRYYTWKALTATNNLAPTTTSITDFGQGRAPSSVIISHARATNLGGAMISYAGFSRASAESTITAAQHQASLGRFTNDMVLTINTNRNEVVTSYPQTDGLGSSYSVSWYRCASAYSGSDKDVHQATVPAGCTEYTSAEGGSFVEDNVENDRVSITNSTNLVGENLVARIAFSSPTFHYYTASILVTNNSGGGGGGGGGSTPSNPVPSTLSGGGGTPTIANSVTAADISSTPGQPLAGTISGGTVTPVSATVTRVTGTSASAIQTEAASMLATFNSKASGQGANVTVVNTSSGALVYGLIKNPSTQSPIGVPAQDVLMVSTTTQAVLLAAAINNQPAKVNASGVLVVNNGGLLGAAANGFAANTQGELVLLSTPTLLGNFTTSANGSFSGQALIPAGFPVGNHTAVLITAGLVTSMGVTVEPLATAGAAFTGPQITKFSKQQLPAMIANQVTLEGLRLEQVTGLRIGATQLSFTRLANGNLQVTVPALTAGVYDLQIIYGTGAVLTQQAAFRVGASGSVLRTLRYTNFAGDRSALPRAARAGITAAFVANPGVTKVTCTGSTSGTRATASDRRLALRRAQAACNLVKQINPGVETELKTRPASGVGARFRSVTLEFSSN